MIQADFRILLDPPWTRLEPLRLGAVPPTLRTPDAYITVGSDGAPLLRIDLYGGSDECHAFEGLIIWQGFVVIGFGHRVYFVPLAGGVARTINLGGYFGHLYPDEKFLLVASAERLFRFGPNAAPVWTSALLGLDGVVVGRVESGIIYGQGEWDAPGGWRPFRVSLESGTSL